jgi:F-type H+-transporting ATPase subunit b
LEKLGFDPVIIGVYIVNFLVLFLLLKQVAYKPVLEMLEKRKKAIADGLAAAEKAKMEADAKQVKFDAELQAARQSSQEEASRIAQDTAKMREKILEEARKEAEEVKAQARRQIEVERQGLQAEMKQQLSELTVALTRKIIGQSLDEKSQHNLVRQFLIEMGE